MYSIGIQQSLHLTLVSVCCQCMLCAVAADLLTAFGVAPDCEKTFDNSGTPAPFYDTDPSTCNAFAKDVQIQATSEVSHSS
jgi:hypothetical protein